MAGVAGLRESRLHVIRVRGGLVVGQVAGRACGYGQVVVVVDVAACAGDRCGVKTCQWKTGSGVVECRCRRHPTCRRMAICAIPEGKTRSRG